MPKLDACIFVEEAPDVTVRDGLFHVTYWAGSDTRYEFVLRPPVFSAAMLSAEEARAKWGYATLDCGNVRKIKP